jgi:DNA primase
MIPNDFIQTLLARVDIVAVIDGYVPLKKAGANYAACCPFHTEKSPSFTVSPTKQFYHCFGCGAHGSAIKFLMDYDRMEFVDAVEDLAARVGLKVPFDGGRRAPQEDSADLYTVIDAAAKFYQRELAKSDKARAYFDARGLDAQTPSGLRVDPIKLRHLAKPLQQRTISQSRREITEAPH